MVHVPSIEEISRRHVEGMIEAYLRGETGCTLNWIFGAITKGHSVPEAARVLSSKGLYFRTIDASRLDELLARLGLNGGSQ